MSVAPTLERFLDSHKVDYHLVHHPYSETAMGSAIAAHVPANQLAKAVVLKDDEGFMMAVVPSNKMVDLNAINRRTNRMLTPASQRDVRILFGDCQQGAVPAIGQAYNLKMMWDENLAMEDTCYMEGGNHTDLIKMEQSAFMSIMEPMPHGMISH